MDENAIVDEATRLQAAGKFQMRSCRECNPAHEHLHSEVDGPLFVCFACGTWYYRGLNLTATTGGGEADRP